MITIVNKLLHHLGNKDLETNNQSEHANNRHAQIDYKNSFDKFICASFNVIYKFSSTDLSSRRFFQFMILIFGNSAYYLMILIFFKTTFGKAFNISISIKIYKSVNLISLYNRIISCFYQLVKNLKVTLLIGIVFFIVPINLNAKDLCKEMNLGWHFYCDPKKLQKMEEPANSEATVSDAKQKLKIIQEKLEDLKTLAVMYPTKNNVTRYIAFQHEQLERASLFSDSWKRALWDAPELDYLVKAPISTIGNELRSEVKNKSQNEVISGLGQRYGLFFFYSAKCSFCQRYSPILKVFADHYKIDVMAISMDGQILPEWPNTQINRGQVEKFDLTGKPVPATILFDTKTQKLLPVGFGLLSITDLEERIYELINGNYTDNKNKGFSKAKEYNDEISRRINDHYSQ